MRLIIDTNEGSRYPLCYLDFIPWVEMRSSKHTGLVSNGFVIWYFCESFNRSCILKLQGSLSFLIVCALARKLLGNNLFDAKYQPIR